MTKNMKADFSPLGLIVALINLYRVFGHMIRPPENAEVVVGSRLTLFCQTDIKDVPYPIEWHYRSSNNVPFNTIYKNGNVFGNTEAVMTVSYNTSSGLSELVISFVSLNHAGTYKCLDDNSETNAEAVVLERYPSDQFCSLMKPSDYVIGINQCLIETDQIQLSCQLRYQGKLKPYLEWFVNGDRKISSTESSSNGTLTSTVVWKADELQSTTFSCHLKYKEKNIMSTFTWNKSVPVSTMLNASSAVNVSCKSLHRICPATEHFGCKCNWTDENDNTVSRGSILLLTDLPVGHYRGIATCFIREKYCSFVSEQINHICEEIKSSSSETAMMATIIIVSVFAFVFFVTAVVLGIGQLRRCYKRIISEHEEKNKTHHIRKNDLPSEQDVMLNGPSNVVAGQNGPCKMAWTKRHKRKKWTKSDTL